MPLADTIIGSDRRLRHPAVQVEIECRVGVYANQVEQYGRMRWLPKRGSGKSARATRLSEPSEPSADESE